MKEKLSALMDGEWDEGDLAAVLAGARNDAAARGAWDAYQVIGDALRGHTGADFSARVSRRLAEEPTVLAPAPSRPSRARSAWYAMSAAASVAAVALVVWTALSLMQPRPQLAGGTGAGAPIVPVAASAPAAQPQPRAATPEPDVLPCSPAASPQPPSSSSR
jgi:sigma-E factor negative regulatory protein RseA